MSKEIVQQIRQDFLNGMSYAAIGRKYAIDSRTAKRYVINNLPLEELDKRPFASVLDSYKGLIDNWLLNGPIFSRTIHDRLGILPDLPAEQANNAFEYSYLLHIHSIDAV